VLEGFEEPACVTPGRQGSGVWLTTMDEVIDCRTKKGLKIPKRPDWSPGISLAQPLAPHAARQQQEKRVCCPPRNGAIPYVQSKIELIPG